MSGLPYPKVTLNRLGANHIERLWSYLLGRGLKISHTRRTLNAALNDAVKRGLIGRSPVKAAETPRDPETEIEPYTTDQMAALLATARGTRNAARWTVAMALGLRQRRGARALLGRPRPAQRRSLQRAP